MKKLPYLAIIVMALSIFLFGCIGGNDTKTSEIKVIDYGDSVVTDYTLWVDGKIVDTSSATVAQQAGIYLPSVPYQPMRIKVLHGQGIIKGFIDGLVGMKEGEIKNVTVSPASGYGLSDQKKINKLNITYTKSLYEEVPASYLESIGVNISNKSVIKTDQGLVAIWAINGSIVTLKYLFTPGTIISMYGLPQVIENITNDTALVRFDVKENTTYYILDSSTGTSKPAKVTLVTNESFILDENHPYAGKTLIFELHVRTVQKANSTT
jgi:FKBP-type peptidyl-prolyl cis-trans isomerase 2